MQLMGSVEGRSSDDQIDLNVFADNLYNSGKAFHYTFI